MLKIMIRLNCNDDGIHAVVMSSNTLGLGLALVTILSQKAFFLSTNLDRFLCVHVKYSCNSVDA